MRAIFERVSAQLSSGETGELAELHALSSGLKATVSFQVRANSNPQIYT
jgi:hypothetical protein